VLGPWESILKTELWLFPPTLALPRNTEFPATSSDAGEAALPTPTSPPVGASANLCVTTSSVPPPCERKKLFGTNCSPWYVPNSRTSSGCVRAEASVRLPMRTCACEEGH